VKGTYRGVQDIRYLTGLVNGVPLVPSLQRGNQPLEAIHGFGYIILIKQKRQLIVVLENQILANRGCIYTNATVDA
jgi:hypothetical protein